MSWRQYEYALAVAEEGSVTAAADRLRVAQPSVSQQLRTLERDLGVTLFTRTPRGLVPTVAGRGFLAEAQVAVAASRRARAVARATTECLTGELVLIIQAGLGMCQLPRALGRIRDRFPGLELSLVEEPDAERIARRLGTGEADVALGLDPIRDAHSTRTIAEEHYAAVLPRGHALLAREAVAVADLDGERLVRLHRASGVDRVLHDALQAADVDTGVAVRASQLATAARLAAEGLGVAVLPASSVPAGYGEHLRPISPALAHTVFISTRGAGGVAEEVLRETLSGDAWCVAGSREALAAAAG